MEHLLVQMIFARNGDTPKWLEFLPIILIAVFYAVGNILKSRADKAEKQKQGQGLKRPIRKPVFRPPEGRGAEPAIKKTPYPHQRRPGQPVQRQPRPQMRPPLRPGSLESIESSKLPQTSPKIEELPEFTSKAVKVLEEKPIVRKEIPRIEVGLEYLLDVDDPEGLRRAILHYEILGKPLSLRGAGEQIIGL